MCVDISVSKVIRSVPKCFHEGANSVPSTKRREVQSQNAALTIRIRVVKCNSHSIRVSGLTGTASSPRAKYAF